MPLRENEMGDLFGTMCFGELKSLQPHCKIYLAPEAQEVFTIVLSDGLDTLAHVSQGSSDASSY